MSYTTRMPASSTALSSSTTCPICRGAADGWSNVNGHPLNRCSGCGVSFVWPQPTASELAEIYSGGYFEGSADGWGFSSYQGLQVSLSKMFRRHLRRISTYVATGELLDVGCAFGFFLFEAARWGWSIRGVEISPDAAKRAAELTGAEVFAGTLSEAVTSLDGLRFDAVTFWDTLEHVSDPISDLRDANKLLRDGGCVFLSVPKAWGVLPRVMGRHWFGYKKAGEHLFFHTKRSLETALAAAGFDPLLIRRTSWTCNVGFLAGKLAYYSEPFSRLVTRIVKSLRLQDVSVPFPWINAFVVGRKVSSELDPTHPEPRHP